MKKNQLILEENLFEREKNKYKLELENEKKQFISQIKQIQKDDILPKQPEKLSLWRRIIKVLMG
jgi:c-di-GMP-binding flagellar brake protein YcgR